MKGNNDGQEKTEFEEKKMDGWIGRLTQLDHNQVQYPEPLS